ncbi:hypothetical protein MA16_Dca020869 [Dendrobium catenatum]|uniref:Uncharacterized protein n=1 Tax=Dendrobium catenatum TaxID=906689 RepID=A0A2I0X6X6_9ASPA|nr:hypothetical protein MA16_Dca020869 [Dendrobium catenatum]
MEEQIRSHIRLTIEDSGTHQRTSMGSNIYDLIVTMGFPHPIYQLKWDLFDGGVLFPMGVSPRG